MKSSRDREIAFYLPADEDDDGRLDHVTVVAERGFSADEVQALGRVRDMRFGDGNTLRLMMAGLGSVRDFTSPQAWR